MIDRYELVVGHDTYDKDGKRCGKDIFDGYFRTFDKAIRFASCFDDNCFFWLFDCFKNHEVDRDLVDECIFEMKGAHRCYEVCD